MQKARYLVVVSCACASAACGTEVARAVDIARDAGPTGIPVSPPVCNSNYVTDRIIRGEVTLPEPVSYRRAGYYYGHPQDDRIAFATTRNNGGLVAWLNSAGTHVHVTAITPDLQRDGDDVVVEGTEVSGLVAFDDGFALLTRRTDPGEPLGDAMTPVQAAYLVRWQNGAEAFAVPLTGTKSITNAPDSEKRDYPTGLSGRLAFSGAQFGAYFTVRGAANDRYVNLNSDKLVQVDETGLFAGGWRAACRQSLGTRLLAEMDRFVPFCISDGEVGTPGLYAALGTRSARRLATEVTYSSGNYATGNFGSAVPRPDGYLVAWASRGVSSNGNAANNSHEPAVALVNPDLYLVADSVWPFQPVKGAEPAEDAVNVHAAPYGNRVLLVWETIASPQYRPGYGHSTGQYGGLHFRFVDFEGNAASEEEEMADPIAPNGPDDIVQFPTTGDLGWAYVVEPGRSFETLLTPSSVPNTPPINKIGFVRLTYCTGP